MKKRLLFILCLSFIAAGASFAQTRTVTNRDLEKFRQKRVEAEREYRENYEKLGFPSPEELERRREQSRYEAKENLLRQKEERAETESDFRARASALRSEIASVEAQINYVNSLLPVNQLPTDYFTGGIAPFGYARNGRSGSIWRGDATGRVFLGDGGVRFGGGILAPNSRAFGNAGSFGNFRRVVLLRNDRQNRVLGNRNRIRFNVNVGNVNVRGRVNLGRRNNLFDNQFSGYYAPIFVDKYDYSQDELLIGLRSLAQARAGLYAEWQLLREEAQRAGFRID